MPSLKYRHTSPYLLGVCLIVCLQLFSVNQKQAVTHLFGHKINFKITNKNLPQKQTYSPLKNNPPACSSIKHDCCLQLAASAWFSAVEVPLPKPRWDIEILSPQQLSSLPAPAAESWPQAGAALQEVQGEQVGWKSPSGYGALLHLISTEQPSLT